jgi:hypothetical protein
MLGEPEGFVPRWCAARPPRPAKCPPRSGPGNALPLPRETLSAGRSTRRPSRAPKRSPAGARPGVSGPVLEPLRDMIPIGYLAPVSIARQAPPRASCSLVSPPLKAIKTVSCLVSFHTGTTHSGIWFLVSIERRDSRRVYDRVQLLFDVSQLGDAPCRRLLCPRGSARRRRRSEARDGTRSGWKDDVIYEGRGDPPAEDRR